MGISDKIPAGTGLLPESILTEASGPDVKGTVKDSVFRDLFGERKYAFQLYQALHPEDVDATEADIGDVTIHNVFTDQEYNDLGMTVRGKVLVMLEAQTSWTMNIIVRILLYLAHIWNEYIESANQNRYGSKKLELPRPELYMIYTGSRKSRPKWLKLSDEFFDGNRDFLEAKVRVLYGEGKSDIISQYVDFTNVYNEQVRLYGRTREAVLETIRICKDRNVLKEYLENREKEVISIMMGLFDQKKAVEQYGYEKMKEGETRGEARGAAMGEMKKARETALNMQKEGFSDSMIAKILNVGQELVQQWLSGGDTVRP